MSEEMDFKMGQRVFILAIPGIAPEFSGTIISREAALRSGENWYFVDLNDPKAAKAAGWRPESSFPAAAIRPMTDLEIIREADQGVTDVAPEG